MTWVKCSQRLLSLMRSHIVRCIEETENLLVRHEGNEETYKEVSHRLSFLTGEINRTLSTIWHQVIVLEEEEWVWGWPESTIIRRTRRKLGDLGGKIIRLLDKHDLLDYIWDWLHKRGKTLKDFLSAVFFEKTWEWFLKILSKLENVLTKMKKQLSGMNFHEAPNSFSFSISLGVPPSVSVSYGVGWNL